MATKSQLKQYFETGKIPTQAQFGELIDFFMPQPSDDAGQRNNQTLKFGQDDAIENPIINGLRTVHYKKIILVSIIFGFLLIIMLMMLVSQYRYLSCLE